MQIATKRFLIRDFDDGDRQAFLAYHQDPRYLAFYRPEDSAPSHANDLIDQFEAWANATPRQNFQLAIASRVNPTVLVGCCGLRLAGQLPGKAELGLELAAIHWGRYGYAIEIARALLGFGFGRLGLDEIVGVTSSANVPVRRLAQWFGAAEIESREGPASLSAHGWSESVWHITRDMWEKNEHTRAA